MGFFKSLFKVGAAVLGVAAVVFTAGAALGVGALAGGWAGAAAGIGGLLGEGILGTAVTGALTFAGYGAVSGGIMAALGKKNILEGMTQGAIMGGITGGIAGGLASATGFNPLGVAAPNTDLLGSMAGTTPAPTDILNARTAENAASYGEAWGPKLTPEEMLGMPDTALRYPGGPVPADTMAGYNSVLAPIPNVENQALANIQAGTISGHGGQNALTGGTGGDTLTPGVAPQNPAPQAPAPAPAQPGTTPAQSAMQAQTDQARLDNLRASTAVQEKALLPKPWYDSQIAGGLATGLVGMAGNIGKDPVQDQIDVANAARTGAASNYSGVYTGNAYNAPNAAPGLIASAQAQQPGPAQGPGTYQYIPGKGVTWVLNSAGARP